LHIFDIIFSIFSLNSVFEWQQAVKRHDVACLCWKCHWIPINQYYGKQTNYTFLVCVLLQLLLLCLNVLNT